MGFTTDSLILLTDGITTKLGKDLRRGDVVLSTDGKHAIVKWILYSELSKDSLGGDVFEMKEDAPKCIHIPNRTWPLLRISSMHPFRLSPRDPWQWPVSCPLMTKKDKPRRPGKLHLMSIMLYPHPDGTHPCYSVFVNGTECLCMGTGQKGYNLDAWGFYGSPLVELYIRTMYDAADNNDDSSNDGNGARGDYDNKANSGIVTTNDDLQDKWMRFSFDVNNN